MNPSALPPLVAQFVLIFGAIAYQAVRRPMQRRLAGRDVARRRGETALVIAGSLLGTALITGSFVVGDTLDASVRATATTQLGPVDETMTVLDPSQAAHAVDDIKAVDSEAIDGVVSMTIVPASFSSEASGRQRAEPRSQFLELDFDTARNFGGDPAATGLTGPTPGTGEVAITDDLATELEVSEGDAITGYLYGHRIELTVSRLLPRLGLAGYWRGFQSTSMNAFIAPGTIAEVAALGTPKEAVPPLPTILVSNAGGVEDGVEKTGEVKELLEDVLPPNVRVDTVKKTSLDTAELIGDEFSQLFLGIGSFAIIAGVLLLVNIFVMLAEERKNQLGMLRAIGMKRADLVRIFVMQGAIYTLIAGLLGTGLGIFVGWAIVKVAAPIFSSGEFTLDLTFFLTPASLIGGFLTGAVIAIATVFFTSLRISRINIIRAIRDLPEPKVTSTRRRTVVAGVALALVGGGSFFSSLGNTSAWAAGLLGPVAVGWGLVPLAGRFFGTHRPVIAASAFSLVWGIWGNSILGGQFFESGDIFAFVLQGITLTFSAVVLLSQTQEVLESWFRRFAARRLPLRLGLAYPLARRFRTGLTLGMFALVIFTMVFIATLSDLFSSQVETAARQSGGAFEVVATASAANPPTANQLRAIEGVADLSVLLSGAGLFQPESLDEPTAWPVTGIDQTLVDIGPPKLDERIEGATSDEVWARLLSDPRSIVVDPFFLQGGGGPPAALVKPGDEVPLTDPVTGRTIDVIVIGVIANDVEFAGSMMSSDATRSILGVNAAASRFFIDVAEGFNPEDVASRLQDRFIQGGLEADSFVALTEEQGQQQTQFLRLMQGYLALGLLVGIAGLGVVMVRAVRERRRDVGVLRSLGFVPHQVRRAFLFESGFVSIEGILIGAILALVTASQLVANGDFGEGLVFDVPWLEVGIVCGAAGAGALVATVWPAQRASQIPPAVALRIAD